jgi:hypothetical protein
VCEEIRWVIHVCSLHGQKSQLLGQSVPAEELTKVQVDNIELLEILEGEKWDRCVEGKFLISLD